MGQVLKKLARKAASGVAVAYGGHKLGQYIDRDERPIIRPEIIVPPQEGISANQIIVALVVFLAVVIILLFVFYIVKAILKGIKKANNGNSVHPNSVQWNHISQRARVKTSKRNTEEVAESSSS